MMNLLQETLEVLKENNKKEADVCFVTNGENVFAWEEFCEVAKDINYDDGFGTNEIKIELKIVGKDWWLEREEYDGSEWWEFKTIPILKSEFKKPNKTDLLEEQCFF